MKPKKRQVRNGINKKGKKTTFKEPVRTKNELIIRVEPQNNFPAPVTPSDLLPEKSGSKYMIQKTWMTENQVLRIIQKTPPQHIYTRPGKGGKEFTYVTGNYIEKVLNFTFGWNWDFEVTQHGREGNQVWVLGKLTVKSSEGDSITKTQFGRAEVKFIKNSKDMVDYGNDLKAATTDALKKCASLLGIASDIYGKNEFKQEANRDVQENNYSSQPNNPRDIQVDHSDSQEPVKKPGQVLGPDGNYTYVCAGCGDPISDEVAEFSQKVYGKRLCREDQKNAKKK